ncbi:P-loop containing nucleoside triphosphate hydrolase protein [Hygrophoropsis aurantiaca]|uniref:P-loop containing nucleoside triphosphate hydrolase protein n=1 Tax=Hygrophoropsis aurantiaca TaxID=72124 RepID=A0ACB8A135_9AGAM|nr:P-loop containing nucleoside triphosphate hydrolase protein [Hygrophoropsis aurantiaca]
MLFSRDANKIGSLNMSIVPSVQPAMIDLTEDIDELDVLGSSRSSTTLIDDLSPPTMIVKTGVRLSMRPRQPGGEPDLSETNAGKRARRLSVSGLEPGQKKQKMEDKKANTIVINAKRVQVEAARRRWLHCHRDIFLPLLPSPVFFDGLQKEVNELGGKAAFVPLREMTTQPSLIKGGEMKDYQLHGLSFLVNMHENGMNCILGDEMGLGKTLQTLSLLAWIRENDQGTQDPHLIICPLSVLSSWQNEAARWLPSFRVLRFHGTQAERDRLRNEFRVDQERYDLVLTTYEAFVAEDSWFKSRRWFYCVLDEGHRIKNSGTNLASKVRGVGALHRLILTGTPVQNNMVELWGLLHWLYPTVFTLPSERLFHDSFDLSRGSYSIPFLKAAQKLLAVVMLRRTKANVEISVPPREELTLFLPMTEAQRFWTYRLLTRMDTLDLKDIFAETVKKEDGKMDEGRREVLSHIASQIERTSSSKGGSDNRWKKLMNLLMQLRKVCDHPYLLKDAAPAPFVIGEHVVASSSKLMAIDKLLGDILPKGERVLIFSQWTSMLDLLEDFMELRAIPYARLDGGTTRPRRTLDIKLFQQEKSPYQVFLVSTKAGGLGINLTKASTVVMCDSDWNPQNDLQAIARAHRIGQTKIVKVYRLICRGSVEDQMLDRIRRKLFLSLKVMGSSETQSNESSDTQLKTAELMDILRRGSSALSRSDDGMNLTRFLDAGIEEIIEDSREKEGVRDAKMKQELDGVKDEPVDEKLLLDADEEERKLLSGIAQVQSRLFEGKVVARSQDNSQIAKEWQELQKRARVDRTVVVDGITVIAEHLGQSAIIVEKAPVKKRAKAKFESEDWCIYCRDGGEVVLCTSCPRVFHGKCHGMTPAEVRRAFAPRCSQHNCTTCDRTTGQAGGMLFRCQTCPQAFCEDCLPDGDIDAIGDILPEFHVLGYGITSTAYYIRCHDCHAHWKEHPEAWKTWEEEMKETEEKLAQLNTQEAD